MRERTSLEDGLKLLDGLTQETEDSIELIAMGEAEDDTDVVAEAEEVLSVVRETAAKAELQTLLSGEVDANDCYLEVHAGAGGTEAQDWAEMLLRMYTRWAESKGYKVEWLEESAGEEAGLKSSTVRISGHNAYGWMKTESGVHRLVRISPYDSSARRHTSFSSIWVYPVIPIGHRVPVVSTSTRPTAPFALLTCRPISSCSVRTTVHSTRTGPPP